VRTWIADLSAMRAFGAHIIDAKFYELINVWIAGFGVMSDSLD